MPGTPRNPLATALPVSPEVATNTFTMVEVEPDKQGRITIPTEFCDFAGLKKNVVVAGVGKRLEIWDADKYYKTMERARNIRQTFDYSQIQF